nr:flocculation protein FLO11-like [Ipomoea batatas]GME01289.1 flocculation protein FLO11-like [Ipomoea batatas]
MFSGDIDKPKSPPSAAGKRRRWISLSLCRKQKSAAKTVPIADSTAAPVAADDEVNRSKEIHVVKSDSSKKTSSKNRQLPATPAASAGGNPPGETILHKTNKASRYEKTESTIIDKTKTSDHSNSTEHLTIHNKKASKKNISAGAGATDDKTGKSQIKKKKPAAGHGGVNSESNIDSTRNQDFTYGMSLLMVILIIMLFWGRVCAIVCTAAWFYFVPRIKRKNEEESPETARRSDGGGGVSNDALYFSSAERKKKVVLDGFLERNHRTTIIL